jgi:hypothetical protein
LDLWDGSAWFSAWFYHRLHWRAEPKRRRLDALQPHLPDGAWESLLRAVRDHLERQMPLDLKVCAKLPDGSGEWWHIEGLAERNAGGQPVSLACTTRAVGGTPEVSPAQDGSSEGSAAEP